MQRPRKNAEERGTESSVLFRGAIILGGNIVCLRELSTGGGAGPGISTKEALINSSRLR
jgi:hypothetical protein